MKIVYNDGSELICQKIEISGNYVYADDMYSVLIEDIKEIIEGE